MDKVKEAWTSYLGYFCVAKLFHLFLILILNKHGENLKYLRNMIKILVKLACLKYENFLQYSNKISWL